MTARFVQLKASAGSGKTYALTSRFLDLLARAELRSTGLSCGAAAYEGYAWPEIMAVTFTNKAAAEMRERVVAALKGRALGQGADGPAAALSPQAAEAFLARILRHYQLLNIRTVDSLLSRIILAFALDLDLPPDFEAVFDPAELTAPLYDRLLAEAEAAPGGPEARMISAAMDSLVSLEGARGFDLADLFTDRLDAVLLKLLAASRPYVDDPEALGAVLDSAHEAMLRAAQALHAAMGNATITALSNFAKLLNRCLECPARQPLADSAYLRKDSLAECVLAASAGRVGPEHERLYDAFRREAGAYRLLRAACAGAMALAPFLRLAEWLRQRLGAQQAEMGLALASAWPERVRLLLEPDDAAAAAFCRLGFGIRHLLVDEFQDTNREQWRAILPLAVECLAAGGSLFCVGDVKQSIYAWRGGDWRLLEQIAAEPRLTALAEPDRRRLETNWRSCPQVVEFNNRFFAPLADAAWNRQLLEDLFGDDLSAPLADETAMELALAFAGHTQQAACTRPGEGLARIRRVSSDGQAEDYREAIRAVLVELLAVELPAAGRRFGDMAVLVRTNGQAAAVAGWLLDAGLPVLTENSLEVARHPLVGQLAALMRFVDHPPDNLALAEVLLGDELFGGAAGIPRAVLTDWLAARGPGSLARDFQRAFPQAWESWLAPFLSRAGPLTPYDLCAAALERFDVERRRPQDLPFARRFLEIVHAAERQGCGSLATFLDHWTRRGADERLPLPEKLDAVRVMTIHKAKGLEFPVAVVPFPPSAKGQGQELAEVGDDQSGVLLTRLVKDLGLPYQQRATQELLQDVNLAYVAWTRAAEELHALLPCGGRRSRVVKLLDALLEQAFGVGRDADLELGIRQPGAAMPPPPEPAAGRQESAPALAASAELPRWLPRLKIFRHYSQDARLASGALGEAGRGQLFHAALERLAGAAEDPASLQADIDAAVLAALTALPPPEAQAAALADEMRAALAWVASLPDMNLLLAAGRAEAAFLDQDGQVQRLDLLAETGHELVVVDYKTGGPDPLGHAAQVRGYMRLASAALGKPSRGLLVYLDRRECVAVAAEGAE